MWIAHRCNDWETIHHEVHHADVIEVDIVITKDNKFLLNHDLDVNRLIVSQHNSGTFRNLIELTELLRKISKPIYIDIKWDPRVSPKHFAKKLYRTLFPFKHRWSSLYLFTFDLPLLEQIRNKFIANITIGWLIEDATLWDYSVDCDIVGVDYQIAHLVMTNKPIFVYTVNDFQSLRHLKRFDGIVSDKVEFLQKQVRNNYLVHS